MRRWILAGLALAWAGAAQATDLAPPDLDALKWVSRPIVIFADSPNDPRLAQQLEDFAERQEELDERDVVILVDTDPSMKSDLRTRFRPRDFRVLVIGKDGEIKYRKSNPVTAREVIRLIDRLPLRRDEIAAQRHRSPE